MYERPFLAPLVVNCFGFSIIGGLYEFNVVRYLGTDNLVPHLFGITVLSVAFGQFLLIIDFIILPNHTIVEVLVVCCGARSHRDFHNEVPESCLHQHRTLYELQGCMDALHSRLEPEVIGIATLALLMFAVSLILFIPTSYLKVSQFIEWRQTWNDEEGIVADRETFLRELIKPFRRRP